MCTDLCPYFGKCGGCLYQDMPTNDYLAMKKRHVIRCFSDYNLSPNIQDIISIPIHSRRRASFAFHKDHLGFNEKKSHTIIDIKECRLLTENLCNILFPLRDFIKTLNETGDVFVLDTPYGIDMHIKTKNKNRPNLALLEKLAFFANQNNIARLLYNNDPIAEQTRLPFPPDVFLQPSLGGETTLVNLMISHIGEAKTALDLFCGTGTFTNPLINAGLIVKGYDSSVDSVKTLGTYGQVRDLFRNPLLPSELNNIDVIIIDPPRAGAKAQIEQLAQSDVRKIIMISCNPSSAARDIKVLIDNGWTLDPITLVDQFTYSGHIELFCVLSK
ncbi:MAG: class I SAM-dependent RNA methyltransferase [Alphaproteobacteria bacterium]|nr:class I SAM-dependent RNA methyltransferase [Alphaproteobacteria bacterium]